MAILRSMPDSDWIVVCKNAKARFVWIYKFKSGGQVSWLDQGNGMTGSGSWKIAGNKLTTKWSNSTTTEEWNMPIDSDNWIGTATMKGEKYDLNAKSKEVIIVGKTPATSGTIFTRTPESKANFISKCRDASERLQQINLQFSSWLSKISLSYSQAFQAHEKLLREISATEKLAQELLLGFALAFTGGMAGGAVGATMKAAQAKEFMIDGVKDIAKHAVRGPGAALFGFKSNSAMPTSPLDWQNQLNEIASKEMAFVAGQIIEWRKAVQNDDDSFDADFDPVEEIEDDLIIEEDGITVVLSRLPDFKKEELQKKFEQGWLDAWIKRHGKSVTQIPFAHAVVVSKIITYGESIGLKHVRELTEKHIPDYRVEPRDLDR